MTRIPSEKPISFDKMQKEEVALKVDFMLPDTIGEPSKETVLQHSEVFKALLNVDPTGAEKELSSFIGLLLQRIQR